jgi:hypothetical protein
MAEGESHDSGQTKTPFLIFERWGFFILMELIEDFVKVA